MCVDKIYDGKITPTPEEFQCEQRYFQLYQ